MSKIKLFIQQSWLLIVASFFFGLLLAMANTAWAPRIRQNKIDKINALMAGLIHNAEKFELAHQLTITSAKGKQIPANLYKALTGDGNCIGYCFNASGPGFADKIELVLAIDKNFKKIAGFDVLSSNETPGFGDHIKLPYYRNQFAGVPADTLILKKTGDPEKIDSDIVAITGATISSEAVVDIINNVLPQMKSKLAEKALIPE